MTLPKPTPVLFPGLLGEIAQATGADTALKIAAVYGGTRIYIPAKPSAAHPLSRLVGHAAALAIGAALVANRTGLDLLIPMGPDASKRHRWRRMAELIDAGLPKRQIARVLRVHERTVQAHRNKARKTVAPVLAQADLFD